MLLKTSAILLMLKFTEIGKDKVNRFEWGHSLEPPPGQGTPSRDLLGRKSAIADKIAHPIIMGEIAPERSGTTGHSGSQKTIAIGSDKKKTEVRFHRRSSLIEILAVGSSDRDSVA